MSRRGSHGFTLIELLVVIAIIAILAGLLFPVFARARETARKIQCIANVKNVATAIQMYLGDYDRFPPYMHDPQLIAYMNTAPGGQSRYAGNCGSALGYVDPYLRWPVVLDEYIKNRDIWICPSAQTTTTAGWIVPNYTPLWWQYLVQTQGVWGTRSSAGGPCYHAWPTGWGGTVTDSIAQGRLGTADPGAVQFGIGATALNDRKTSEITDPSWLIVCGDNRGGEEISQIWGMFYGANPRCCYGLSRRNARKFYSDPSYRVQYAPHLGGANIGFADGHAAWWAAEAAVTQGAYCGTPDWTPRPAQSLKGTCPPWPVAM
jgi:prepilin-type N-terminal cleavage/methylation domain-containing protein/prepilin-type processing-associated H-X9-DG protein